MWLLTFLPLLLKICGMTRSLCASSMHGRGQSRQDHRTGALLIRPGPAGSPLWALAAARMAAAKRLSPWIRPGRVPCGGLCSSSAALSDLPRSIGVGLRHQHPTRYSLLEFVCARCLHLCSFFNARWVCPFVCAVGILFTLFWRVGSSMRERVTL